MLPQLLFWYLFGCIILRIHNWASASYFSYRTAGAICNLSLFCHRICNDEFVLPIRLVWFESIELSLLCLIDQQLVLAAQSEKNSVNVPSFHFAAQFIRCSPDLFSRYRISAIWNSLKRRMGLFKTNFSPPEKDPFVYESLGFFFLKHSNFSHPLHRPKTVLNFSDFITHSFESTRLVLNFSENSNHDPLQRLPGTSLSSLLIPFMWFCLRWWSWFSNLLPRLDRNEILSIHLSVDFTS